VDDATASDAAAGDSAVGDSGAGSRRGDGRVGKRDLGVTEARGARGPGPRAGVHIHVQGATPASRDTAAYARRLEGGDGGHAPRARVGGLTFANNH
jgi:hypothetical protein